VGAWRLDQGRYAIRLGAEPAAHDHEHHDHPHDHDHDHGREEPGHAHGHGAHPHEGGLGIVMLPLAAADATHLEAAIETAVRRFAEDPVTVARGGVLAADGRLHRIDVAAASAEFLLEVRESGSYALFCEHAPGEFNLRLDAGAPLIERAFASHHHHDEEIGSIGIVDARPLDARKLNEWLSYLLQSRGQDIFRMKGVLSLRGEDRRYVFHGVHMMFDGRLERPWGGAPRQSSLIFIGRKLDRRELEAGFESCLA
jgi:hypothetical protein